MNLGKPVLLTWYVHLSEHVQGIIVYQISKWLVHISASSNNLFLQSQVKLLVLVQCEGTKSFRVISIIVPVLPHNNKMIGRRALAHAEKASEVVDDDQHGSRNNR